MNQDPEISLDLHDIQGNVIKAYNRLDYSRARYVLFEITHVTGGREFIKHLVTDVTTAAPWSGDDEVKKANKKPKVTLNIALTFRGLQRLGLPEASLLTFPQEFVSGMLARREILGDDHDSSPRKWDPVWRKPEHIHILVTLNGPEHKGAPQDDPLHQKFDRVVALAGEHGVRCLDGHRGPNGQELDYQQASVLYDKDGNRIPKEHFGYTDGISNPYFKGAGTDRSAVIGGGKVTNESPESMAGWEPLETGEFLLGYKDEAFEFPEAPMPPLLGRNGTYLVFRKLHENVAKFNDFIGKSAQQLDVGEEEVAAKFVGRWRNGAPLTTYRTEAEANEVVAEWGAAIAKREEARVEKVGYKEAKREYGKAVAKLVAFDYDKDFTGSGCPVGAHARRMNPRGGLEFGRSGAFQTRGALTNRRRLLRRGFPYGQREDTPTDDGDHGVIFMILGASIRRQFEFVQQQWLNYGNDFKLGNDKDPLVGNHGDGKEKGPLGRMVIESEPDSGKPPLLCGGIPRFVETRGGEYFFLPSVTALRMIGEGIIDPT